MSTCKPYEAPGACPGLNVVRLDGSRWLFALFCESKHWFLQRFLQRCDLAEYGDSAHRLDESCDLPVCASRGRFVGGVWRSA